MSGALPDAPDVFTAFAYGDSVEAIKMAALDQARGFYGAEVPLQIEGVGSPRATRLPSVARSRGRYSAQVVVRCLRLPEGW